MNDAITDNENKVFSLHQNDEASKKLNKSCNSCHDLVASSPFRKSVFSVSIE